MDNRDLSQSCYNDLLKDRRKRGRKSLAHFQHQLLALPSFISLSFVFLFLFSTFLLFLSSSLSFVFLFSSLFLSLSLSPFLILPCLIKNRKKKSEKNTSFEQMLQAKSIILRFLNNIPCVRQMCLSLWSIQNKEHKHVTVTAAAKNNPQMSLEC